MPTTKALPAPRNGPVHAAIRLWYNPGRSSNKFYGPGIFVLALSLFPPLLAALAMAKEGEQKTILQVYVSSISAHEFLLGKILASMVDRPRPMVRAHASSLRVFRPRPRRRSDAVPRRDPLVHVLCRRVRDHGRAPRSRTRQPRCRLSPCSGSCWCFCWQV